MSLRSAGLLGLWALGTGCYSYQDLAGAAPAEGQTVAITLTPEGSARLQNRLGPGIGQVEGRIDRIRGDSLLVAVNSARNPDGFVYRFSGDTVLLDRGSIAAVRRRRIAAGSSALVGGIVVAGVAGAAALLSGGSSQASGGAGGPGPVK
jgi:hypothetical protein